MESIRRTRIAFAIVAVGFALAAATVTGSDPPSNGSPDDPLHVQIDQAIEESHFSELSRIATDAEFLRRVYLHLAGRSPTVAESRAFLADADPVKQEARRAALIDRLLASSEFNDYFSGVLDVMLMERRGGVRIPIPEWQAFLHKAVEEKWPYDRIIQTVVSADGTGEHRGASKWLIQREVEPNALTRDIGRLFLGRDLQCAQCHDHPNVGDYEQAEYYGILSFVNRSYLFEDESDNKKSYVGEKAEGDATFVSVFSPNDEPAKSIPFLLTGLTLDAEPRFDGDELYVVAPTKATAGLPKFSRRMQLARLVTHPQNRHFAKNSVNRFWAHMMGRGIVEPVDFHHSDNPPSHPALLETLGDHFVRSGFDIRELLRQIALSKTYQRSVEFPTNLPNADGTVSQAITRIDATISDHESQRPGANSFAQVETSLNRRRRALADVDAKITEAAKALSQREDGRASAAKTIATKQKQLTLLQKQHSSLIAAEAAAKKVADSFPGDKSLAKTHVDYKARIEKVAKQVAATKSAVETQQKADAKLQTEIDANKRTLARLRAKRIGLADMVAEVRGALNFLKADQERWLAEQVEYQQRRDALELRQEYLEKVATHQAASQRLANLNATGLDTKPGEELAARLYAATVAVSEQQADVEKLASLQDDLKQSMRKDKDAIETLSNALEQSRKAAETLGDGGLDQAITVLNEKRGTLEVGVAAAEKELEACDKKLFAGQSNLTTANRMKEKLDREMKAFQKRQQRRKEELAEARLAVEASSAEISVAEDELRQSWERRFAVRSLSALSPEQLAGSTISAFELRSRFEKSAEAEWANSNKKKKPEEVATGDAKAAEIEALVEKRVGQVVSTYVSMFAAPGGAPQDVFSSTADQALFLANDGRIQNWLGSSEGGLLHRVMAMEDSASVANELYLAILCRSATNDERDEVANYLESRGKDRTKAIREIAWGLLSSLEFRFNH